MGTIGRCTRTPDYVYCTVAVDTKSFMKTLPSTEMVSVRSDSQGGINIMRTRHDIMLHVHCKSCYATGG